ncbi:V-type ATP synthase subunit E [Aerococcus urinaeequi]|uniref:V-type ATP synthase subunit E n=1 Tax=Aerococcus urinaeequi TaxID=51665 RepID=A0AA47G7K0_9LACT|nr:MULTISPECIES: V-type ATP synthase subunit E [Lactobacillales]MCY7730858.1 V-type ATP synthase subunit E [Aerococcus urinaeequi]MDT2760985.1 V-type ATP synthase subunit E [Aerococcus urinaeequi]WAT23764.1 V-type ATP synthase subunit E [Aerococcus urinaeequi]
MDLEDKFAYFETQVNQQAQDIIDEQVNQYRATLQKDYDEFVKNTNQEFDAKFVNAKKDMRKELNKNISQSQIHLQRDLYLQEEKLKKTLFAEFNDAIQNYMQTDEYRNQLVVMINNLKDYAEKNREELVVYINHSDQGMIETLLEETNANIQISDREFLGGVRGVLKDRQVLIDYSFSTLLANVEDSFTIKEVDD